MRSLSKVRTRWLAPRSLLLHLALVAWVAGCVVATWWQIGRAIGGNEYSYLYAVEWPVFAIAGVFGWWALLHTEPPSEEAQDARREEEARLRAEAAAKREREEEDEELAAYNDHLAQLAANGRRRGWRS